MSTGDFFYLDTKLNLADPLTYYKKLMEINVDCYTEVWQKISDSACNAIWTLLFYTRNPSNDERDRAAALLKQFKEDARLHNATGYNAFIYKFRDELLAREELGFWKNVVVAQELGPVWARDSNMFDRINGAEPENFYNHAGCKAPWLLGDNGNLTTPSSNLNDTADYTSTGIAKSLIKLTKWNAVEAYEYNMLAQKDINPNDGQAYKKIFDEVREVLWELLFSEPTLSVENTKIASDLLLKYKLDASWLSPYDYNQWIHNLRDELFRRKYFNFWDIIVKKRLSFCWAYNSFNFNDK